LKGAEGAGKTIGNELLAGPSLGNKKQALAKRDPVVKGKRGKLERLM